MAITVLNQTNSLNPGADLWIIPTLDKSKSAQRLDWYMNFQMTRASLHQAPDISSELKKILQQCRLPEAQYRIEPQEKIMFDSSNLLPNRWLVMVCNTSDFQEWTMQIVNIWSNLRKPTMRVFLPTGLSSGDFQKMWKGLHSFDDFSLVVD